MLYGKVIPHYPTDSYTSYDINSNSTASFPSLQECKDFPVHYTIPKPASEINYLTKNSAISVDEHIADDTISNTRSNIYQHWIKKTLPQPITTFEVTSTKNVIFWSHNKPLLQFPLGSYLPVQKFQLREPIYTYLINLQFMIIYLIPTQFSNENKYPLNSMSNYAIISVQIKLNNHINTNSFLKDGHIGSVTIMKKHNKSFRQPTNGVDFTSFNPFLPDF